MRSWHESIAFNAYRKEYFCVGVRWLKIQTLAHTADFVSMQYTLLSMVMRLQDWYQDSMNAHLTHANAKLAAARPSCPHCGEEEVQRFGQNRGGTVRWRCTGCWKTFTPHPNIRTIPPLKVDIIKVALAKGCSKHVIAQAVRVSPKTVYRIAEGWVPKGYRPAYADGTPLHLLRDLGLMVKD